MFDIGFWELMLIGVMGLVVLGPERLPVAIRSIRGWISGVRKFSDTVKSELTEELRIHELHSNLKKAEASNLENLSPEVAESLKSLQEAAEMVNRPYKIDESTLFGNNIPTDKPVEAVENSTTVNSNLHVDSKVESPTITDKVK